MTGPMNPQSHRALMLAFNKTDCHGHDARKKGVIHKRDMKQLLQVRVIVACLAPPCSPHPAY
jgi:hypothetical protein